MQGLYEYVRPRWEDRPRPEVGQFDVKNFGSTVPNRPTVCDNKFAEIAGNGNTVPS
jgi:hypothetical protein